MIFVTKRSRDRLNRVLRVLHESDDWLSALDIFQRMGRTPLGQHVSLIPQAREVAEAGAIHAAAELLALRELVEAREFDSVVVYRITGDGRRFRAQNPIECDFEIRAEFYSKPGLTMPDCAE